MWGISLSDELTVVSSGCRTSQQLEQLAIDLFNEIDTSKDGIS